MASATSATDAPVAAPSDGTSNGLPSTSPEVHDIVILGAGLSGINAAYNIRNQMPHREFTVLEARDTIGGTWSFFRYPGFRSDSGMNSFGLSWHPWPHAVRVGQGSDIAAYINDAADQHDLRKHIRFNHKVVGLEWRDADQAWTIETQVGGQSKVIRANFVISCTGYYSYDQPFPVEIPGIDDFGGQVIHPQWWPEDFDYSGKRIVIVGSGATAVTILPVLAEKAASVTQLQRSPSYIIEIENLPRLDRFLQAILPLTWYHTLGWYKGVLTDTIASQAILKFPKFFRRLILKETKKLVPSDVDVDKHFNPRYNVFQQRLCMTPDGEYFKALHRDNTEIVTDVIKAVTKDGILLESGRKIEADVIVTATGLYFQVLGGVLPVVNGKRIVPGEHYTWRGFMLEALPNMAFIMGYVTQTWTPGAEVMTKMAIRILKTMEKRGATSVVPLLERWKGMPRNSAVGANSSYFVKAVDRVPKVTGQGPWYGRVHLLKDYLALWFGSMDNGLVFGNAPDTSDAKKSS
jgi:cation diffusion facilitator CzcD-associated flavoprotein CzcO